MGMDITLRTKKEDVIDIDAPLNLAGFIEVAHFSEGHAAEVIAILLGVSKKVIYEMADDIGIVGTVSLEHVISRIKLLGEIYGEAIVVSWSKEAGDIYTHPKFGWAIKCPEYNFINRLNEFIDCLVKVGKVDINDIYMSWG
jgi:hypothetical protein